MLFIEGEGCVFYITTIGVLNCTWCIVRSFGELGCAQSLLPLHSMVAAARLTSHLSVDSRAWRELSQGTLFCRTCPDR